MYGMYFLTHSTRGLFEYLVKLKLIYCEIITSFEDWSNHQAHIVVSPCSSSCSRPSPPEDNDDDNPSVNISKNIVKAVMLGVQRVMERERKMKQRGNPNNAISGGG